MGIFDIFNKRKQNEEKQTQIVEKSTEIVKDDIKEEVPKKQYFYNENNDYLCIENIEEEIKAAEENGLVIPLELKTFFRNQGYGFIAKNEENLNFQRLLSPEEMVDFKNRIDIYSYLELDEYYKQVEEKGLIFMEYCEETYIWIGTNENNLGEIYYFDEKIADSFNEFIEKLHNNIDFTEKENR